MQAQRPTAPNRDGRRVHTRSHRAAHSDGADEGRAGPMHNSSRIPSPPMRAPVEPVKPPPGANAPAQVPMVFFHTHCDSSFCLWYSYTCSGYGYKGLPGTYLRPSACGSLTGYKACAAVQKWCPL